jgi:integrase
MKQMKWATALGGQPPALLFTDGDGKQLNRTRFYISHWNPLRKRAGLPGLHFHDLRHVHSSLMGKAKVHPSIMQARLGHADAAMSLEYAKGGFVDEQREVAATIEALVGA